MMEMIGKRMGDDWLVRSIGLGGVAGDRTAGNETLFLAFTISGPRCNSESGCEKPGKEAVTAF
jgi:hypothetical protein